MVVHIGVRGVFAFVLEDLPGSIQQVSKRPFSGVCARLLKAF